MSQIKYGVWFHGNAQEDATICYAGREPYIVNEKSLAESYMGVLKNNFLGDSEFSVCIIIINEV